METMPPGTAGADHAPRQRGEWALPVMLAVVIGVASALLIGFRRDGPIERPDLQAAAAGQVEWTPSPAAEGQTVSFTIDFGNGAHREFTALPWTEGMTVGDLMRRTRGFRPGITFTQQGAGEKGLLTSLEGVHNQDGGGGCWLYEVDGRPGEVSFDVQPLTPGDSVLWRFSPLE